tara:strand:- start:1541 stop:1831 length:291 start_codon:yes stop_codon:yes gene_type:complete
MPANMRRAGMSYGTGGGSKKKMKSKKRRSYRQEGGTAGSKTMYGGGGAYMRRARMGTGMSMPNDVMNMVRAQQGKQMKGAMKLFNALAKKLGKKVK